MCDDPLANLALSLPSSHLTERSSLEELLSAARGSVVQTGEREGKRRRERRPIDATEKWSCVSDWYVIMAHKRRLDCANGRNYDSLLRKSKVGLPSTAESYVTNCSSRRKSWPRALEKLSTLFIIRWRIYVNFKLNRRVIESTS